MTSNHPWTSDAQSLRGEELARAELQDMCVGIVEGHNAPDPDTLFCLAASIGELVKQRTLRREDAYASLEAAVTMALPDEQAIVGCRAVRTGVLVGYSGQHSFLCLRCDLVADRLRGHRQQGEDDD